MTPSQIWILGSEHGLGHGHSRASMSKHRLSTSKHKQARANFGIFWFWAFRARYHRFCAEFLKEMTPSKNRILGSPEFQTSKFFNVGHFEPDITDFVKNSWREMIPSQIWILVAEHELAHGHHTFSAGIRFPILRFPFPYIPGFACFCGKPQKHCCFCTCLSENIVNIVVCARGLEKTL